MFTVIFQLAPGDIQVLKTGLLSLFQSIVVVFTICLVPLKNKGQKLANTFNNRLLNSKDPDTVENNEYIHEQECIRTPASTGVTEAQSLYFSTEWAMKIDNTLNKYPTIPLSSQPNY